MGLFDKIFGKYATKKEADGFFRTLTAYAPAFTSWGGEIYECGLVRAAVHAKATHMSKLKVEILGSAQQTLQTRLRQAPNSWQTWSQLLYRLTTILEVQNTAFIVPVISDDDRTIGVYPVLPTRCEIVQYGGEPWLRYTFVSGEHAAVELSRCGILTKFQYKDDFFGEDNRALTPTMELINIQNQGIAEGVRSSATFRFMARVGNFAKNSDLAKERKNFTESNLSGEGGVLLFPNTYTDIKQINSTPFVVDANQMNCIRMNVFDYFGVNEEIIQNKAFGDAWDAFYEGAIEPMAIQLSEVLTNMLFTQTERSYGAKVMATSNRLQYMSVRDKILFCKEMGDRGYVLIDEGREVFNMAALPNGEGQKAPVRGEYQFLGDKKEKGVSESDEKSDDET